MSLPFTAGPPPEPSRDGSSIVNLIVTPGHSDDRPTIISPTPATMLIAGQKLGHFELLGPLGRGGMATVLKARDLELGRNVALKILPPETTSDAEAVQRFKQEARAAASLDSDYIARVYFCGEERGLHFIAFEYIPGDNLRVAMKDRLSPALAVRYLLHVAHGLQHAAERGIVHRDIKPSNIIITPDGQAKIVDMGLARSLGTVGGMTQSGVTLGTFDYISPEQALDPRKADVRSDIYSLGCTFYHALTGVPPVPEGTAAKKLQAHQHEAPVDPRDHNPAVPESLAAVLARMMAKDPAKRYATATALIEDLQAVAVANGYSEAPEGMSVRAAPTLDAPKMKVPLSTVLVAIAACVVLVVIFGRGGSSTATVLPPWGEQVAIHKSPALDPGSASKAPAARVVATVEDFVEAVKNKTATITLKSGTTFDLRTLAEGVTVSDATVTIEPDGPGTPPKLVVFAGSAETRSLTFRQCKSVSLRGVEIEVTERDGENLEDTPGIGGIGFDRVGRVSVQGCRVAATGLNTFACTGHIELSVTATLGGRWQIPSDSKAEFRDCAFSGPVIRVVGESDSPGECKLVSCTFLIDSILAPLRVDDNSAMTFHAGYCLFAGTRKVSDTDAPDAPLPGAVLAVASDARGTQFTGIEGQPNGYFGVLPIFPWKSLAFADAPAALFKDAGARQLPRSPWAATDPRMLLDGSDPPAAFRLSLTDPRLRLPPASGAVILGVKSLGLGDVRIYPGPWPPERAHAIKAAGNERVVWPEAEAEDAALRLYPTFASAYAALLPNETLSLAVSGEVPIASLPEKTLKATIRAAVGYKPVLVPDGPSFTTDAALFRLADGEIAFENLEVRLKDRQSIVHMAAGTVCSFRKCILTLAEKDDATAAAVVIPDAAREMRMPVGSDETPRVTFTETILRGEGQGVWVQAARGFDVTFEGSAAALLGSLIRLDASERSGVAPRGKLTLKASTLVLNESLVEVHAGKAAGTLTAAVAIDADGCIMAAADSRSTACSLVLLDDVEPNGDLTRYLQWTGRGCVFAYAEAAPAVEWRGSNDTATGSYDWPQWLRFTRDDGKHLVKLRFAKGPLKPKLSSVEAGDFALSVANPLDAGVDVEKLP